MLTPDYQEFANRVGRQTAWQYRDLRHSHVPNFAKSRKRCAFATQQGGTKAELSALCRNKRDSGGLVERVW